MAILELLLEGGCTCGGMRYRLNSKPLIVHCCHCRWCQREIGTAFALNAMIETDRVVLLKGRPLLETIPSFSGKGQQIARCPDCLIALWSHYAGGGSTFAYVRVGTLDDPGRLPPDVHIFTMSKQPWVVLPEGVPAMAEFYSRSAVWRAESLERRRIALEGHPKA